MADISSIKLPSGNTYDVKDIFGRQSIPYGIVTSDSTTVFTATVDGVTQLANGVCCMIRNNNKQTSASGWTLNVNSLGAKPVYNSMADATRDTTIFNKAYTMLFVYDEDRVDGGCWICYRGYNSDNNTIGYQLRTNSTVLKTTDRTRYYRLLFTSADGTKWVPANTKYDNSATSVKTVNSRKINPFGRIVYLANSTNYAADTDIPAASIWQQYVLVLGYSFNNTGVALTLTTQTPVYVKAAPQSDGSAIIDSTTPFVQALPSTEDGKIYIYLGIAYDATHIELQETHPVYYYKDSAVRLWTGATSSSGGSGLVFTNQTVAASAWASNSDLDYYGYRASIPLTGVTASMMPQVTFTDSQLAEYDLAPICQSYAGGVYIYSAEAISEAITIPSIGLIGG